MGIMKLSKATAFTGRNGTSKCTGFSFFVTGNDIHVCPITSKGVLGNCRIEIPKKDVQEFCTQLQGDMLSLVLKNLPPDCLPGLMGLHPELNALIAKELKK